MGKSAGGGWGYTAFPVSPPAGALREEDLGGGAEEIGHLLECPYQGRKEIGLQEHVVIQQAHMRKPGAPNPAIDPTRERKRGGRDLHPYLRPDRAQPLRRAIVRAVIHHDDFGGEALQLADDAGQLRAQQVFPVSGRNHHGDPGCGFENRPLGDRAPAWTERPRDPRGGVPERSFVFGLHLAHCFINTATSLPVPPSVEKPSRDRKSVPSRKASRRVSTLQDTGVCATSRYKSVFAKMAYLGSSFTVSGFRSDEQMP